MPYDIQGQKGRMIAVIAPFAARGPGPRADRHRDRDWSGGGLPVGLSDRDLNAAACIEKHAACIAEVLRQRAARHWAGGPRPARFKIHAAHAHRLSIHLLVSAIAKWSLLRPWREATAL